MAKRVRITLDGVAAVARLHEDVAPRAVARFWAALPLEDRLRHVRWSGDAGYFINRQLADPTMPIENPVTFYPPGGLMFRREHGEFAFSYGQAQARDHTHIADWACHLATLEDNAAAFLDKVRATAAEGGKPIRIVREAE